MTPSNLTIFSVEKKNFLTNQSIILQFLQSVNLKILDFMGLQSLNQKILDFMVP